MAIVRWRPWWAEEFEDFEKSFGELSQTFGQAKGFVPAIDVYQDKDNIMVETPLPGIDPDKVEISIENDVLTIKGISEQKKEIEEKEYYRREVRTGSFFRSVALPAHVIGERAEANYDQGILKIKIPKESENKSKTIKVKMIKNKVKEVNREAREATLGYSKGKGGALGHKKKK